MEKHQTPRGVCELGYNLIQFLKEISSSFIQSIKNYKCGKFKNVLWKEQNSTSKNVLRKT